MRQILNFFCSSAFLKKGVSVAVLGISCSSVFALPSDRNQPISLVADRATCIPYPRCDRPIIIRKPQKDRECRGAEQNFWDLLH